MKSYRRWAAAAAALGFMFASHAAVAQSESGTGGLPPLIDREILFGDPDIAAPQLSPDGTYVAFLRPLKGARNIWVKRVDQKFDDARSVTAETRPIAGYAWSRDGKYILYVRDQDGDENFNAYAVDPAAPVPEGAEVPPSRNLTNLSRVRVYFYALPKSEPDIIYIGLNDRDPAWHDIYRLRISTGERELVRMNTERFTAAIFDTQDRFRLVTRAAENGDTEILRVDPEGFTKIYTCSVLETCQPGRFHKDGRRVYLVTNKSDAVNLVQLELLDVQTGKTELVESDPEKRVDLGQAIFSEVTDELVGTAYVDARVRIYWRDARYREEYELLRSQFPGMDISRPSVTRDESMALIAVRADTEPGAYYLFERKTRRLTPQFRLFDNLPREALTPVEPIEYASSDGLEIPAYLSVPKGVPPKNLPLLVFPHGGPWARDTWGYHPYVQFATNRGFAVLQPNFRGSTGYGKKFLNAGNGQWGELMQDDITYGVCYLVSKGIVDPKRVAIMGISYGGYATLAGIAFTPDMYAAAVSYVGPSNLVTLLNSIPAYWEAGRRELYTRIADPNTPEGKAKLERQSPLNAVSRIKTPLMVIQGANDPRVKQFESDQIVVALRERNFPVEYYVAPDEGHGFQKPVNNIAALAAAERFLARHIRGVRYQESMTPEVSARLAEITVDPETVQLTTAAAPEDAPPPKPVRPLQAGTYHYNSVIELGGQRLEMKSTVEIRRGEGSWSILESVHMPQGVATDSAELAPDTLTLVRRSVSQGPIKIAFTAANGKLEGSVELNGQARPISIDVGGDLIGDGPGGAAVIGTLPLAEGYATTLRGVNLLTQQLRLIQLKVLGSERLTVPAGEFDSFKVELAAADGFKATVWIAKEAFKVLKAVASVPEANGAVVTSELST